MLLFVETRNLEILILQVVDHSGTNCCQCFTPEGRRNCLSFYYQQRITREGNAFTGVCGSR